MAASTDPKAGWITRVLGVTVPGGSAAAEDDADPSAMGAWKRARTAALASLKALEGAFRDMDEPEVDRAIILLRAIRANLTPEPTTEAQWRELESYLATDQIIADAEIPNGFGIKIDLRAPLMAAVAGLRRAQASGGTP